MVPMAIDEGYLEAYTEDPIIWINRVLRLDGMPEEEILAILNSEDQRTIHIYMELHRERVEERLEEQLRTLDAIEQLLTSVVRVSSNPTAASGG